MFSTHITSDMNSRLPQWHLSQPNTSEGMLKKWVYCEIDQWLGTWTWDIVILWNGVGTWLAIFGGVCSFNFAKSTLTPVCTICVWSRVILFRLLRWQALCKNGPDFQRMRCTSGSVSVCNAATLGSLEFSTSLCCCISSNSSCIWNMPPTSSSNLHSNMVMALVPCLPWDWSVESFVCFYFSPL